MSSHAQIDGQSTVFVLVPHYKEVLELRVVECHKEQDFAYLRHVGSWFACLRHLIGRDVR